MVEDDFRKIVKKEAEFQDKKIMTGNRSEYAFFYRDNQEIDQYFDQLVKGRGKLLVLGCSDTKIERFFKKGFKSVVGIDISQKSLEKINQRIAKKKLNSKVKVILMDVHSLKFANNAFDLVLGEAILHHLDLKKALPEIYRVLKKRGKIIFLEPLGMNLIVNWYRKKTPFGRTKFEHPLKIKDFKILEKYFKLQIKGFYLLTILSFGFKIFLKSDFLYRLSRKILFALDSFLLFFCSYLKYYCWLAVLNGEKK